MSTRCLIRAKLTESVHQYAEIYCHSDGYPEKVGNTLLMYYNNQDKINELISHGDLSILDDTVEMSTFYHRDRGEEMSIRYESLIENFYKNPSDRWQEFEYFWDGASWFMLEEGDFFLLKDLFLLGYDTERIKELDSIENRILFFEEKFDDLISLMEPKIKVFKDVMSHSRLWDNNELISSIEQKIKLLLRRD